MSWRFIQISPKGVPAVLQGVNLWACAWKHQGEIPIAAQHPEHQGQTHELTRYFVEAKGKVVQFAASEVSPGIWLFYAPNSSRAGKMVALQFCAWFLVVAGGFVLFNGWEHSYKYALLGGCLIALGFLIEYQVKRPRATSEA